MTPRATKSSSKKAKPRTRKAARLRIDLSQWDLGDWSDRLREAVKIRVCIGGVDETFPFPQMLDFEFDFDDLARHIATEAVQTFLSGMDNSDTWAEVTKNGLEFRSDSEFSGRPTLKLEHLELSYATEHEIEESVDAWHKALDEMLASRKACFLPEE